MPDRNESKTVDTAAAIARRRKALAFTLQGQEYAVDIHQATEVLDVLAVTRIPHMPDFVKGAMNLRGEILTVLDLRPFCGLRTVRRMDPAKVIVTDITGLAVGILVDGVKGTLEVSPDEIQPPLSTLNEETKGHVVGQVRLKDRVVVWLDFQSILQSERVAQLRRITA